MKLKQILQEYIPPAYYPNGKEAKCIWYRIFNMFDVDPDSYIVDNKKEGMNKKEDLSRPNWGPEIDAKTGKLVDT